MFPLNEESEIFTPPVPVLIVVGSPKAVLLVPQATWSEDAPRHIMAGKHWDGNHLPVMSVGSYVLVCFVCSLYLYSYDCSLMKHMDIDKDREKARLDKKTMSRGFHSHLFSQAYLWL